MFIPIIPPSAPSPAAGELGGLIAQLVRDYRAENSDEVQRFKNREEPLEVTTVDIPNLDHFAPGSPQEEVHPM